MKEYWTAAQASLMGAFAFLQGVAQASLMGAFAFLQGVAQAVFPAELRAAVAMATRSTNLLSLVAALFPNLLFAMLILYRRLQLQCILTYFVAVLFFAVLYLRRRHRRHAGLRRGLGHAAVALGLLLSALFFFSGVRHGVPWHTIIGLYLAAAEAARRYYLLLVLHLDDIDDDSVCVEPIPAVRVEPIPERLPV